MKQLINYLLFLCIGCCFSFFYDHQLYRLLALLSAVILASISYLYTRRTWTPYAMILFALPPCSKAFCTICRCCYTVSDDSIFLTPSSCICFRFSFICVWKICIYAVPLPFFLYSPYPFGSSGRKMRKLSFPSCGSAMRQRSWQIFCPIKTGIFLSSRNRKSESPFWMKETVSPEKFMIMWDICLAALCCRSALYRQFKRKIS